MSIYPEIVTTSDSEISENEKLSQAGYWSERYQQTAHQQQTFDWFLPGHVIYQQFLQPHLTHLAKTWGTLRILDIGCGNSSLPCCVYTDSGNPPLDLHLVDYVADVLDTQRGWLRRSPKGHPSTSVQFVQCDVTCLPYRKQCFHLVVDKGTTDAVLKDRVEGGRKSHQILTCVDHVLHTGGVFLHITDEDPDFRLGLLQEVLKSGTLSFTDISEQGREYFVFQYKK